MKGERGKGKGKAHKGRRSFPKYPVRAALQDRAGTKTAKESGSSAK